jgi:Txe/YoeB family toxin of toxin-antitoxin system
MWKIVYTKQAIEDSKRIIESGLKNQVKRLISILEENPYKTPPKFEKLKGDLTGAYSRRINIKHRLVYQIIDELKTVKIIRMWTHYQ